jgi:hypothetical protein
LYVELRCVVFLVFCGVGGVVVFFGFACEVGLRELPKSRVGFSFFNLAFGLV